MPYLVQVKELTTLSDVDVLACYINIKYTLLGRPFLFPPEKLRS